VSTQLSGYFFRLVRLVKLRREFIQSNILLISLGRPTRGARERLVGLFLHLVSLDPRTFLMKVLLLV